MLAMQKVGFGVSVRVASAADQPVSLPIAQWCFVAGIGGPESDNVSSSVVILLSLAPFCLTSLTTYALSSAQPTPTFPFRSDTIWSRLGNWWCESNTKCWHKQRLVRSVTPSLITPRSVIPSECTSGSDLIAFFTITAILAHPVTNTHTQRHTWLNEEMEPLTSSVWPSQPFFFFFFNTYNYPLWFKIHQDCTWSLHVTLAV